MWEAIFGLVGVFVGALFRPWFDDAFGRRRKRKDNREQLIAQCRGVLKSKFTPDSFRATDLYRRLSPHLPSDLDRRIQEWDLSETNPQPMGIYDDEETLAIRRELLKRLAKLERKWMLL